MLQGLQSLFCVLLVPTVRWTDYSIKVSDDTHMLRGGRFLHKFSCLYNVQLLYMTLLTCNVMAFHPHGSDRSKWQMAFRFFSSVEILKVLHGKNYLDMTFYATNIQYMNSFLRWWTNTLTVTFFNTYFISETDDLTLMTSLYQVSYRTRYSQTLHKVSCQGSHFVFRFFGIGAASPASSPSSSSSTPHPGVPHGRMFELHQILKDWITENAAGVLGLTSRKWSASLVEVHRNQGGITGITALLSNLQEVRGSLEAA